MQQKFYPKKPSHLLNLCRLQLVENESFIQEFQKLQNQLINSTSKLLNDYKTLNQFFGEKIAEYDSEINQPNQDNIQEDPMNNLQEIIEDYKISNVGPISQMKNPQEELINAISEIRNKHFQCEELPQVYIFDELSTVKKSNRFEDFQKQNYLDCKKRFQNKIEVNAAEISPDETHLVSISRNKIFI